MMASDAAEEHRSIRIKLITASLPWLNVEAAEAFRDVEIVANDGEKTFVNKSVLASISPVLKSILRKFDAFNEILLHLDITSDQLQMILKLALSGSIQCGDSVDLELKKDIMAYLGLPLHQLRLSCGDETFSVEGLGPSPPVPATSGPCSSSSNAGKSETL